MYTYAKNSCKGTFLNPLLFVSKSIRISMTLKLSKLSKLKLEGLGC